MKKLFFLLIIFAAVYIASFFWNAPKQKVQAPETPISDYKNIEYTIDGQKVKLTNGLAEKQATTDSASKTITKYFGNELKKDLDNDGREDVVFLLTQDGGGSGTFFYVVGALNKANGYMGSQAYFVGDRIAPQNITSGSGSSFIVNFAERLAGEPMTVQPSQAKSLYLQLDPATLEIKSVKQ